MTLEAITLPPPTGETATHLIVALHGWGANSQDLLGLAPMLQLSHCQFIFPNAPFPHPQVPEGRAWYTLDTETYEGLEQSRQILKDWLNALVDSTGIPLERTLMLGFSQGGAMSLDIGLQLPLKAVCSISGYLQFHPHTRHFTTAPPVLLIHGRADPVVPVSEAHHAQEQLSQQGVQVSYHEFPHMGHGIPPEALKVAQDFLQHQLSS